jgi:hypothetical protein
MHAIYFTSHVSIKHQAALEKILYFNALQNRYRDVINTSIQQYGQPKLTIEDGRIRLYMETLEDIQSIFAMDGETEDSSVLGVLLYHRVEYEGLIILHIAIDEQCSFEGEYSNEFIVMRLILQLKTIAKNIRGVKKIKIAYNGNFRQCSEIRVKR